MAAARQVAERGFEPARLHPFHIPAFKIALRAHGFELDAVNRITDVVLSRVMPDLVPKQAVRLQGFQEFFTLEEHLRAQLNQEALDSLAACLPEIDRVKMKGVATCVNLLIVEHRFLEFNADPDRTKQPQDRMALLDNLFQNRKFIDTKYDHAQIDWQKLENGEGRKKSTDDQHLRMQQILTAHLMKDVMDRFITFILARQIAIAPLDWSDAAKSTEKLISEMLVVNLATLINEHIPPDIKDRETRWAIATDIFHLAKDHFTKLQQKGNLAVHPDSPVGYGTWIYGGLKSIVTKLLE